jgi:hypothetical protein
MQQIEHAAPLTADIGDVPETFASIQDVQRAVYARVSGSSRARSGTARCATHVEHIVPLRQLVLEAERKLDESRKMSGR